MDLDYTYWDGGDGWLIGHLDKYPEHLTEGHDVHELEEMLEDIYKIRQDEEIRLANKMKSGVLKLAA
jgi:hypothetical protein